VEGGGTRGTTIQYWFINGYSAAYIQGLYKGARVHRTGLAVNQGCSQVSTICKLFYPMYSSCFMNAIDNSEAMYFLQYLGDFWKKLQISKITEIGKNNRN
jgi:hypothetical protein